MYWYYDGYDEYEDINGQNESNTIQTNILEYERESS